MYMYLDIEAEDHQGAVVMPFIFFTNITLANTHTHTHTHRAKKPTTNQGSSLTIHIYTRNISVQLHVEVSPQKYNHTISAQY